MYDPLTLKLSLFLHYFIARFGQAQLQNKTEGTRPGVAHVLLSIYSVEGVGSQSSVKGESEYQKAQ